MLLARSTLADQERAYGCAQVVLVSGHAVAAPQSPGQAKRSIHDAAKAHHTGQRCCRFMVRHDQVCHNGRIELQVCGRLVLSVLRLAGLRGPGPAGVGGRYKGHRARDACMEIPTSPQGRRITIVQGPGCLSPVQPCPPGKLQLSAAHCARIGVCLMCRCASCGALLCCCGVSAPCAVTVHRSLCTYWRVPHVPVHHERWTVTAQGAETPQQHSKAPYEAHANTLLQHRKQRKNTPRLYMASARLHEACFRGRARLPCLQGSAARRCTATSASQSLGAMLTTASAAIGTHATTNLRTQDDLHTLQPATTPNELQKRPAEKGDSLAHTTRAGA